MNKEISVYDNSISARTYLSYIAEQAGGIAIIGRDGKLYIKTFGESVVELPLNRFKDFKWGEKFKITRVYYEDGIQQFKKGDTTGNTVYINQDNMYIVDQEQINNIYDKVKNLEVYSFEGTTIIDPATDIGDILSIDGKKVIYQGSSEYSGHFIASISSKIQCKAKEETTTRITSQTAINRIVQSQINQAEGKITMLSSSIETANSTANEALNNTNVINTTEEAKEFYLTDSADSNCKSVEIFGESKQETRSGKNKLPNISDIIHTFLGVTISAVNNEITVAGTATGGGGRLNALLYFNLPAGSYKLVLTNSIQSSLHICNTNTGTSIIATKGDYTEFTLVEETQLTLGVNVATGITYNDKFKVMIVPSDITDYTYEPYGAMPSPEFPSEIGSVTSPVKVKSTGKNLTNYKEWGLIGAVGRIEKNNDAIILTAGNGSYGVWDIQKTLKPNTTYTAYCDYDFTGNLGQWGMRVNKNGVWGSTTNNNIIVFTTDSTGIITVAFYIGIPYTAAGDILTLKDIRLYEGTYTKATIPDYEPYEENITSIPLLHDMRSLPNGIRDRIYYENGKWYDEQKVGQVVLDGTENWTKYSSGSNNKSVFNCTGISNNIGTVLADTDTAISNYFKQSYVDNTYGDVGNFMLWSATNGSIRIAFNDDDTTTLDDFKTWLSTHNTEVLYELAEPIIAEITDEETIKALESIKTYKGITNITSDANSILTYYRDIPIVDEYETKIDANKKQEQTVKKIAQLEITDNSIKESVGEINTTISNDVATKTALATEIATLSNSVNIKIEESETKTQQIGDDVKVLQENMKDMSYNFSTKGLRIGNNQDANNSLYDNAGIRVYSYNNLQSIFNLKGSGVDKLIVTGTAQLGRLRIAKSTKNGEPVTKVFHLKNLIEDLKDLEV